MIRSLSILPSFMTQGLGICCFLQLECSLPIVTSSLKPASSGSSWNASSWERIFLIPQSTNIFKTWFSLRMWCFPSRKVVWPGLPAFNICLLRDTVRANGGKPLDSAYNRNTRAIYQLLTVECISVAWTNERLGNLSSGLSISLTFIADLLHISSSFILKHSHCEVFQQICVLHKP